MYLKTPLDTLGDLLIIIQQKDGKVIKDFDGNNKVIQQIQDAIAEELVVEYFDQIIEYDDQIRTLVLNILFTHVILQYNFVCFEQKNNNQKNCVKLYIQLEFTSGSRITANEQIVPTHKYTRITQYRGQFEYLAFSIEFAYIPIHPNNYHKNIQDTSLYSFITSFPSPIIYTL